MKPIAICFLLAATAWVVTASAQQKWTFGITAGGGVSQLHGGYPDEANARSHFRPSFQIGAFSERAVSSRSGIGAELLLTTVNSAEMLTVVYMDALGNAIGTSETNIARHCMYVAVPVLYRTDFGKVIVKAGLRADIPIVSWWHGESTPAFPGAPLVVKDGDTRYFDGFDFGLRAGAALSYKLSPRLYGDASYYYGLNNPFKAKSPIQWALHQVVVGVHYALTRTKKLAEAQK